MFVSRYRMEVLVLVFRFLVRRVVRGRVGVLRLGFGRGRRSFRGLVGKVGVWLLILRIVMVIGIVVFRGLVVVLFIAFTEKV